MILFFPLIVSPTLPPRSKIKSTGIYSDVKVCPFTPPSFFFFTFSLIILMLKTPLLSTPLPRIYAPLIMHDRSHQRNNKVRSRLPSSSCVRLGVLLSSRFSPHSNFHLTRPMRSKNQRRAKGSKFTAYISAKVDSQCVHLAYTSYATCMMRAKTLTSQRMASRWHRHLAA